jgi:phage gp45-like
MARQTIKSLRDRSSKPVNDLRNLVRHYVVTKAAGAVWKLLGLIDGDGNEEKEDAPIFPGIGIWARPPSSGKPEAVVNLVGASTGNPAIVATRDEKTRAALDQALGGIKAGETTTYGEKSVVYHKADGTIEARSWDGTAKRLLTEDDFEAFKSWVKNTMNSPPSTAYTKVLKGQ